jgi:hypothetical protein
MSMPIEFTTMEKLRHITKCDPNPRDPKAIKHQVTYINGKLTMEEKMINRFIILLTKATSINHLKPSPSKIVYYENSTQSCGP